ncbi:uncharacterized protein RJT20DRAFT_114250 [Scheffersomyces xylosifermentans]|uniref:uncharacterized protein n=1 Tax=Scheffersomyces xylosifermentans TaxID=1304137 RepID=UPI00315DA992
MSEEHSQRYRQLLREQPQEAFGTRPRKRRKKTSDVVFDDVDLQRYEHENEDGNEDEDEDDEDEDFEDVNLVLSGHQKEDDASNQEFNFLLNDEDSASKQETFTIALEGPETDSKSKAGAKRKFVSISKEEREYRRQYHQAYIVMMIVHGAIRNQWCNDYELAMKLKNSISLSTLELIHQRNSGDVLNVVKSRRFLDGLQKIMQQYSQKFRITSQGLIRKNWNELSIRQNRVERNITLERFKYLVSNYRGSRDTSAQGFVCLLRAIGLNARLVFSLQPPDFTMIAELPKVDEAAVAASAHKEAKPPKESSLISKFRSSDSKSKLLSRIRAKPTNTTSETNHKFVFEDSEFPIFWVEVWNKYSNKWVSIDPAVLHILEVAPMRRKSRFEPPLSETRNQMSYVIAFDRLGKTKDVTRRYCHFYNARTVKKTIQFRSEEDEMWYEKVIRASTSSLRQKLNRLDILELKEFHDRDLAEGMPNNIADFKNHPLYALETHLKHNEVIYPHDETSKSGIFRVRSTRSKNKAEEVITVFKRSHVHLVRSARAWYMRGRVLKMGALPLKVKRKAANSEDGSDEDDTDGRLYAEFQTVKYIPKAIVDGKVPKNAFGNIDVYTPSMLPENGYLVNTYDSIYTMKMAERAARSILNIDYAKAIVAFDFGGRERKGKGNRNPTAREGGIVIDIQFKDAMFAVLDALVEEEEEQKRITVEMNALKNWRFFLIKLRITQRLNAQHGRIAKDDKELSYDSMEEDTPSSEEEPEVYGYGGFVVESSVSSPNHNDETDNMEYGGEVVIGRDSPVPSTDNSSQEIEGGGFIVEDSSEGDEGGGFLLEKSPKFESNDYAKFESKKIIVKESPNDEEDDEFSDLPDEIFRMGDDGELVYDPGNNDSGHFIDSSVTESHLQEENDNGFAASKEILRQSDETRDRENLPELVDGLTSGTKSTKLPKEELESAAPPVSNDTYAAITANIITPPATTTTVREETSFTPLRHSSSFSDNDTQLDLVSQHNPQPVFTPQKEEATELQLSPQEKRNLLQEESEFAFDYSDSE